LAANIILVLISIKHKGLEASRVSPIGILANCGLDMYTGNISLGQRHLEVLVAPSELAFSILRLAEVSKVSHHCRRIEDEFDVGLETFCLREKVASENIEQSEEGMDVVIELLHPEGQSVSQQNPVRLQDQLVGFAVF
jgi:hypothetical protein